MLPHVEVVRDGKQWEVRRESGPAMSRLGSLQEALEQGRQIAKMGGVDLVWEDENGESRRESHQQESGASTRGWVAQGLDDH